MLKRPLAQEISRRLDEKKISVSGLERKAGLKSGVLRNILAGRSKNPTLNVLLSLAKALGCSLDALVGQAVPEQISLSDVKKAAASHAPLNKDLLEKTADIVFKKTKAIKKNFSLEDMLIFMVEIYKFSEKTDTPSPDETFCDWYFERFKN